MKKIFFAFAVAVAALACTKEPMNQQAENKGKTVFTGGFVDTKISLGDLVEGQHPALWEKNDAVAVYNSETGAKLGIATIDPNYDNGNKTSVASFVMEGTIPDGTKVKVVFPADEEYKVEAEQSKGTASNKKLLTKAESQEITVQGGKASFTLSHESAVIRVRISSTDYKDWLLKSACVYSAGAVISDNADYARVTYSDPTAIGDSELAAVFVTKPIETATDFYVSVKLVDPNDPIKTVCLSKKFEGKTLNAGQVNTIPMTGLTAEVNALAWYNPVCTRYIPEGGWCYGESNTFVCAPTKDASGSFDVRAQGDFLDVIRYAKEPKHIQLKCGNVITINVPGVWEIDATAPSKGGYAELKSFSPQIVYKVTSKSTRQSETEFIPGFVFLCDNEKNIIWKYLLWAANVDEVTLTNGTVMDINLGYGGFKTDGTILQEQGIYYQWGRPFPFAYDSSSDVQAKTGVEVNTFSESITNANAMALCVDSNTDWLRGETRYDLWGNTDKTTSSNGGNKSIFDPCPKGWKVASASVLYEVYEGAVYNEENKQFYYNGNAWPVTYFRNGADYKIGSAKGFYWADNAMNPGQALHFEFTVNSENTSSGMSFNGTWRSHAGAVRCMKDTANR